jgi:hypothetical protein
MKKLIILSMCVLPGLAQLWAQTEHKLTAPVVEATVFRDRAIITRSSKISLAKGKHLLIYSGLTTDLQDKSVRIITSDSNPLKILEVKVERRFTAELQQEKLKKLEQQLDQLITRQQVVLDKLEVLSSQKKFIQSLQAESAKMYNQKLLLNAATVKDWDTMLIFIDQKLSKVLDGIRTNEKENKQLQLEIRAVQAEINQQRAQSSRDYKEILVLAEAASPDQYTIAPTYLVYNASWYPMYDARVRSTSEQLDLTYFGMVQQATGEDWQDINLILSTAEPTTMQSIPVLQRWFVDAKPIRVPRPVTDEPVHEFIAGYQLHYEQNYGLPEGTGAISGYITDMNTGEPLPGVNMVIRNTKLGSVTDATGRFYIPNIPVGRYNVVASFIGYNPASLQLQVRSKQNASINIPLSEAAMELDAVVSTLADEAQIQGSLAKSRSQPAPPAKPPVYSTAESKELSTIFRLPAKTTVPSSNSPHKVTIAIETYPVKISYAAIPKRAAKVFAKGKILHDKMYPLLEGELSIFMDNDFVSRSYLPTTVNSDSFEIALGIDDKIVIERNLLNKYTESGGFLSGNTQVTYTYEIKIKNNRPTAELVVLSDHLPISMNEDIQVELLEPKRDSQTLSSDKIITWNVQLAAGEEKVIQLKFKVIHPADIKIYGLE